MDSFKTPLKNKLPDNVKIQIPPSPLMKKIGFGTSVVVYELQRSPIPGKFRSPWAIKKLIRSHKNRDTSTFINDRLKNEADILRKLDHPNVVGFRAFTKDSDGTNILAMEECTSSLGDLIENRLDYLGDVPYPSDTILKVSYDVAKALDYLHNTALLLHCDIKSYNILVKGEFEVCKICDFGVCLPLTKSGEMDKDKAGEDAEYIGTPHWSAPEVLLCNSTITTKADMYSFGLVIWEMLSLTPPIDDDLIESTEDHDYSDDLLPISIKKELTTVRQRPPLPDVDLGPEYNLVLEIYFCCTTVDSSKRPDAKNLVCLFKEALQT
ncbi:unnamed protein product [Diabrotica balteata]|uniref:Protein kinase domain-containing protein n=1 Tax=Diabrotica balteata TaxID=107213 RepID=A0A9N9SPG8_DIABA|nr:unnamed protein product [Diabrotica balteata]